MKIWVDDLREAPEGYRGARSVNEAIRLIEKAELEGEPIEVLDLYVYNLAMGGGGYPLSTAISILKTLVSVILLFLTNLFSKKVRGESII